MIESHSELYEYEDDFLLKKYFNKWLRAVKGKSATLTRNKQIGEFLDRLLQEKEKLNIKDFKKSKDLSLNGENNFTKKQIDICVEKDNEDSFGSYQHRYIAQKHIIALQRAKLDEQKRLIEELKLNKIMQDVSSENMINDVKNMLSQCSRSVKPKMKWIIGNEATSETNSCDSLQLTCMKVPKFIQQMEQRAREREERRAIVKERRRQIELERQRINEQAILEKQLLQQDEKEKWLNEFRERRRQEQLLAIRRKEEREKMRGLKVMADLHYELTLRTKYGPIAWKLFLCKINDDRVKAEQFNISRILRSNFLKWKNYTRRVNDEKIQKADNLYNTKLKLIVFTVWKKVRMEMIYRMQTAEDWYDVCILTRYFVNWKTIVYKILQHRKRMWEMAVIHYECQLLWKVIGCWQMLPTINTMERKQEARKQKWRFKIKEVLPDYIPKEID